MVIVLCMANEILDFQTKTGLSYGFFVEKVKVLVCHKEVSASVGERVRTLWLKR